MEWLALLVIVVVVLFVVGLKLGWHGGKPDRYPYVMNQVLFSAAERSFLGVLEQAIGREYRVLGKVRVADVVSVKSMSDRSVWQKAFNRISAKHLDFVLCRKDDLSICAAIELDDKSHQTNKRQERDAFIAGLCKAIALPLIQVQAQSAYAVADIRARVLDAIRLKEDGEERFRISGEDPRIEPRLYSTAEKYGYPKAAPESDNPSCPRCSSPMVRRKAMGGANVGQEFWGCSAFPKCRSIIPFSAKQGASAGASTSRG